jgi:hypothetical protein
MDSPQSEPGRRSRGAIQHLIPLASRTAQAASTARLSAEEWLMNTSWDIFLGVQEVQGVRGVGGGVSDGVVE